MKTYSKILVTLLPLMFCLLAVTVGISYYFSRNALTGLAVEWLATRSSEAIRIAGKHESILHKYGLEKIPASIEKSKLDAIQEISSIHIGQKGYKFGVDINGKIIFHPNKYIVGTFVNDERWFAGLGKSKESTGLKIDIHDDLAVCDFFPEWNWFLIAADPKQEVYGLADRMKPYLVLLGIGSAVITCFVLMVMTRRLLSPLQLLVRSAEKIGKGELDTSIQVNSHDEFADLADEFNRMTQKLRQTLKELRYREERFRALIENATDMIIIVNSSGSIIYASPSVARITGHEPDRISGLDVFEFVHPDDRQMMVRQVQKNMQSDIVSQTVEFRVRHSDGTWRTLEAFFNNLLDHPAVRGFVVNARDISKRKAAQDALQKTLAELEYRVEQRTKELVMVNQTLNREIQAGKLKEMELKKAGQAKDEFLANITHEVRTPLNSVIGFSELLLTSIEGDQERSWLNAIRSSGKNLLALINDILDLSKMTTGRLELNIVPTNISCLIDEIFQLLKPGIVKKSVRLIKEVDENLPLSLLLDDVRMRQILVNLVGNAVKFTEKGHVMVRALPVNLNQDKRITGLNMEVHDTGIGIPEDSLDMIFSAFIQASPDITRQYGGTGLGLSICRNLVDLMGGTIKVESTPGIGSVFSVFIPEVRIGRIVPESGLKEDYGNDPAASLKSNPLCLEKLKTKCLEDGDLKNSVRTEVFRFIPEFRQGIKIGDVKILIQNMEHVGRAFHVSELKEAVQVLGRHAESFDIEMLENDFVCLYDALKEIF